VVLLWHQLMALAWHGFPQEPERRCALHLPHACPTQDGLCGCCSHVGWGSRQENSQHRLLTAAARHARFTKVPLSAVHTALQQDMSPGQARTACSSKAGAAELVAKVGDDLARQLAQLCLQQPRPPPPAAAASSSQPQQQVASPMQTRHARRARQQQQVEQEQQPGQQQEPAVRPINSRLQVAVGPGGLQQVQQLAPRSWQKQDDASKARRLESAARAAERQQQKQLRWQRDWGGGGQQQQQPAEPSSSSSSSSSSRADASARTPPPPAAAS
jgi:hypothetical protein